MAGGIEDRRMTFKDLAYIATIFSLAASIVIFGTRLDERLSRVEGTLSQIVEVKVKPGAVTHTTVTGSALASMPAMLAPRP